MSVLGNPLTIGGGVLANINISGLLSTDSVSAVCGSKTKQGRWVKPSRLPSGYTEVEYIESSGTQYINTGKTLSNVSQKLELDIILKSSQSYADPYICGSFGTNFSVSAYINSSQTKFDVIYANSNVINSAISYNTRTYIVANIANGSQSLSINGTTTSSSTSFSSISSGVPFYLFALNNNDGSIIRPVCAKIYSCKVYESNSVVLNLVPCKRNLDEAIGMYDTVSQTFFGNSGTGSFTGGNEVYVWQIPNLTYGTWTVTATSGSRSCAKDVTIDVITDYDIEWDWIPSGYSKLDYIQTTDTTGAQYVITDFYPSSSTDFEVRVNPTATGSIAFSSTTYTSEPQYIVWTTHTGTNIRIYANASTNNFEYTYPSTLTTPYILSLTGTTVYLNGTSIGSLSNKSTLSRLSAPIYLFRRNYGDNPSCSPFIGKFYYLKLIESGNVVRHYIPVMRNSDNNVGVYDLIGGNFFAGVGGLIGG